MWIYTKIFHIVSHGQAPGVGIVRTDRYARHPSQPAPNLFVIQESQIPGKYTNSST
ncbi:hypothetical protein FRAHR75_330039 [Frankia sp. Hr75.2]|nr:hypothetical protein FRAHR75_330039 [Frankia sp. Hr75.2]